MKTIRRHVQGMFLFIVFHQLPPRTTYTDHFPVLRPNGERKKTGQKGSSLFLGPDYP
jgi:hypothetical protein